MAVENKLSSKPLSIQSVTLPMNRANVYSEHNSYIKNF